MVFLLMTGAPEEAHAEVRAGGASSEVPGGTVTVLSYRTGRHAGFLRVVLDATGPVHPQASAMTATDFLLSVDGAVWPGPGDAARSNVGGPLRVTVLPAGMGAPEARFRITSAQAAFIRRVFVLPPARTAQVDKKWRLVLDLVLVAGGAAKTASRSAANGQLASLPAMHGLKPGAGESRNPAQDDVTGTAVSAVLPLPGVAPLPPVTSQTIEVSWVRASRILKELRERADPARTGRPPPQLALPAKYRRNLVPLR